MDAWLERLRKEIQETSNGLSESDWSRAPQGRWSSAQIMEHLGRTYGTTAKMLELSMGTGSPPQIRSPKIGEFLAKMLIVKLGVFPSGAKSPAVVIPKGDSGPVALKRTLDNLDRMEAAFSAAECRWGSVQPIAMHLRLGPLNATQWRKFHYLHGHHHLSQMQSRLKQMA
jgi:hypothetical protein